MKSAQAVECDRRGRAVEDVGGASAQAGEHEGRAGLRGGQRDFGAERDFAAQALREVHVVEHDDTADAAGRRAARRFQAEAHERALVGLARRALEGLYQLLDPLVV
ncbi:MAG: hypothetical protein DMF67_00335 [Acidobacteria bacterium]|nr:MAG: hypothetical protein DMF67_00335 [Acidobacteriota bacterium]